MPSINNITSKQVLDFLLNNDFEINHQKGSHIQLRKGQLRVTIPNHGNKTLNINTITSILKQSGFGKQEFLNKL